MTLQLIGAGLGRTGTHSLKLALEMLLGGTCHHMTEVFAHPAEIPVWAAAASGEPVDWQALLADYDAIVDYPGAGVWREISAAFPEVPILLSTRASAQEWWNSASSTILADRPRPADTEHERHRRVMVDGMFKRTLGDDLKDAEAVMAAYEAHNAAVRAEVPADRLFEYQPGDGWTPLCAALGLAIPDEPFPHTNTREHWRNRAGFAT